METPEPSTATLPPASPASLEAGFMPSRAKLIDIAAFLDRVERADLGDEFRAVALKEAIRKLADHPAGRGGRAKAILEHFSDPTEEPIEKAPGKGACGVWDPEGGKSC